MRDIKGPESVKSLSLLRSKMTGAMIFTAQEVGQIIALAMDAQKEHTKRHTFEIPDEAEEINRKKARAWRELAERLTR